MKFYVTRNAISHRGVTVNKGDVIEEDDRNHIGGLQSVGCVLYNETIHGSIKADAPKTAPVEKPEPEPVKEPEPEKEAPKKKRGRPSKK